MGLLDLHTTSVVVTRLEFNAFYFTNLVEGSKTLTLTCAPPSNLFHQAWQLPPDKFHNLTSKDIFSS